MLVWDGTCSAPTKTRLCGTFRERFDGFGEGGEDARISLIEDKLTFAAAGDEAGFREDFQVVGNRGRSDTAKLDQLAASDLRMPGDVLIDAQAGLVGEGLGDLFDLGEVHRRTPKPQ